MWVQIAARPWSQFFQLKLFAKFLNLGFTFSLLKPHQIVCCSKYNPTLFVRSRAVPVSKYTPLSWIEIKSTQGSLATLQTAKIFQNFASSLLHYYFCKYRMLQAALCTQLLLLKRAEVIWKQKWSFRASVKGQWKFIGDATEGDNRMEYWRQLSVLPWKASSCLKSLGSDTVEKPSVIFTFMEFSHCFHHFRKLFES